MNKDIYIDYSNGMNYEEEYYIDGQLWNKGVFINDERFGYHEWYHSEGSIDETWTGYWMNDIKVSFDNKEGICCIWNRVVI